MIYDSNAQLRLALEGAREANQELEAAIDAEANAYVLRCREERKQLRAKLSVGLPVNEKRFSQLILTYRLHKGYMDLYWAQIYRRPGSSTPNFKRVSNKGGAAHISHLVRGAFNADEANLIRSHEFHARNLRKLWSDFLKTRAGAKTLIATSRLVLDDTGLELETSFRSTA